MSLQIFESPLPNIPFEERPADCDTLLWRYSANPVIPRNAIPSANSIFNSAVIPYKEGFAGVFRVDDQELAMTLHAGFSRDGLHWEIEKEQIRVESPYGECGHFGQGFDPRVVFLEGRYYVTWCNCSGPGLSVGIAVTDDFQHFTQLPDAFPPFNRNGVLFPEKINGKYALLNRPSDTGHTPFGDIYYSESPDLLYWGMHRLVMRPTTGWQSRKIGAGSIPLKTSEGWLLFYHGVIERCNGFVYSFGAALLDLEQPWKVLARSRKYLLSPQTSYECMGDVANVVFPCAALCDGRSGRLAIYYGCADTVTGLAFGNVNEIVESLKRGE